MKFFDFHINNRNTYARWVFGFFLLLLIYRWHSSTFLIYAYGAPMKGPEMDYAYWITLCTGLPHFIIQHYWACLFIDVAVVACSIGCFISEKHRHVFCTLLILFFFIQRVTIETFSCSHSKSISCVFVALLPFCFKSDKNFMLVLEAGRYFLIYVMVASAIHKLTNGALTHPYNFSTVLINQHVDLATLNPNHICYRIASKLIQHPAWAAASYIMLFISQIIFIVGFFTKQSDRLLFIFLFAFAVTTYYIMRIYNFDILMLGFTLLYFPARHGTSVKRSAF
ncbi:MAG: hypothetical protein JWN78_354 [Bacteroidota bacterium]|nr:hypothetical protein [Bacteroidota bacterium]